MRRLKSELHDAGGVDGQAERWCTLCRVWLPKEQFYPCKRYGRERRCRVCSARYKAKQDAVKRAHPCPLCHGSGRDPASLVRPRRSVRVIHGGSATP